MNPRLSFLLSITLGCSESTFHTEAKYGEVDTADGGGPGPSSGGPPDTPTDDTAAPEDPAPDSGDSPDTNDPPDTAAPPDTDDPPDPPPPDAFSLGWHILDEGTPIETTSSPSHLVDHHGDTDVYWYEPSGVHGLIDSSNPDTDFEHMRDYVIERIPVPTMGIGLLHYYADSTLDTYSLATFTYILCDFWVDATDDPYLYELISGPVDDGIQVMVNGAILGHLKLDDPGGSWLLGPAIRVGERNTLIVILADDSARNKFVQDMAFYRDGIMVMGEDISPPPAP